MTKAAGNPSGTGASRGPLLLLLLALLLGVGHPGCGSGGTGDAPGDDTPACTTLPFMPAAPTAMRLQDLQVAIELRFITYSPDLYENLGIDFDQSMAEQADAGLDSAGASDGTEDFGASSFVLGGAPGTNAIVIPDHCVRCPLPIAHVNTLDPFTSISVYPFMPGPGCVHVDENYQEAVTNLEVEFDPDGLPANPRAPEFTNYFRRMDATDVASFLLRIDDEPSALVLQAPTTTVYDGQPSTLLLRNRVQPVNTFTTPFNEALLGLYPTGVTAVTGPTLTMVPMVSEDRTEILILIRPTLAAATRPSMAFEFGPSGIPSVLEAPVIQLEDVVTSVRIPDKGSVLIGGFRRATDTTTQPGVPNLRKIPIAGTLATPLSVPDSNPLLILLTPRILATEE